MAFVHLHRAFELEVNSEFQVYESVFDLFARAATPYLIHLCSLAEVKVMKNQLNEARDIYEQCFTMQREFGLNYEPALQASLALLNNSIFSKNCEIAQLRFEEILDDFKKQLNRQILCMPLRFLTKPMTCFQPTFFVNSISHR
jgi:hypothetical protein